MLATGPVPRPATGEVLIRVAAAGVNRPDVLQRSRQLPAAARRLADPRPRGRRHRRRARRRGSTMAAWRPRSARCCPAAAMPNTASRRRRNACRCRRALSLVDAAALPETFFTVWSNVFDRGRLAAGETLPRAWRHRAASARRRSSSPAPLARTSSPPPAAPRNAPPAATRRRARDQLPAGRISSPWSRRRPTGRGVDVILDMVGGAVCREELRALARRRPPGADRLSAGQQGDARPRACDGAAPDDHRLDPAAAPGRGEGGDRAQICATRSGR